MGGTQVQSVYVDLLDYPYRLWSDIVKPMIAPQLEPIVKEESQEIQTPGCFSWFRFPHRRKKIHPQPIEFTPLVPTTHAPDFDPTKHWSTLGDLHGNALKLVYFLVQQGALTMSENDYKEFKEIYFQKLDDLIQNPRTAKEFFIKFDQWVDRLKFTPGAKIRLIGDALADRGSNDYYTLKIIQKSIKGRTDLEILLSNHDLEFMLRQENRFKMNQKKPEHAQSLDGLSRHFYINECMDSFEAMTECMEDNLIETKNVDAAYEDYVSKIKVLSYDYNEEGGLNFYSHAPIWDTPLNVTIELVKTLRNNGFSNKTIPLDAEYMTALIDEINESMQQAIRSHRLSELVNSRVDKRKPAESLADYPFVRIAWHRPHETKQLPVKQPGVDAFCGHELKEFPHSTTLDNTLGRDPANAPGYLTFLVTEPKLRPRQALSNNI